jgi:hypothetical protein
MKKNSFSIRVITIGSSIALSTSCLLNNTSTAYSAESHTIGFLSEGGSFCEMWLASENNDKKHRTLAAPNGTTFTLNIDDRKVVLKAVGNSQSAGDSTKIGSRWTRKYVSDIYQVNLDLRTIKYDNKKCLLLQEGMMTLSTKNWKTTRKVRSGCDPCG